MADDLTLAQARDLACYFLGGRWSAMVVSGVTYMLVSEESAQKPFTGDSWRAVFRAAGVQLPLRPQYVAQGARVMMGAKAICTAVSNTLAKRIAAALNNHTPDRRGI